MPNRLAFRASFVLLLAFAAAVGWAQATPAQAAGAPAVPLRTAVALEVEALGGLSARGRRTPFHFPGRTYPGRTYYTYCVVATDSAGNRARHCDRVTVV